MEVTLGRGQLRVPHPALESRRIKLAHDERSEAMAEVMEAQRAQPGRPLSAAKAAPDRRIVEHLAERAAEHEVVVVDEPSAVGEPGQLSGGRRGERHRAGFPFGDSTCPADMAAATVSAPRSKLTWRQRSARSSPSLSPVKAATV